MRRQFLSFGALLFGLVGSGGCDPEVDPNDDPCAKVRCKDGTHCEATGDSAQCVPDASCDLACDEGSHCELVDVVCKRAPCPPVEQCVLDSVGGTACGPVTCGDGQVCCNASCGICTAPDMACIQVACEPNDAGMTCASVLCKEGTICTETPAGPQCVPVEENPCNLIDCKPNTTCQVIGGEATCVPSQESPCNLIDCPPNSTCEVVNGEGKCVPVVVDPPASCAATLCPVGTYCDDFDGSAECIKLPSCDGVSCEKGQHCELHDVQCVRAPCPPQPTCVNDGDNECRNPCETVRCGKGTHCEPVDVVCVRAPCCPVAECKRD